MRDVHKQLMIEGRMRSRRPRDAGDLFRKKIAHPGRPILQNHARRRARKHHLPIHVSPQDMQPQCAAGGKHDDQRDLNHRPLNGVRPREIARLLHSDRLGSFRLRHGQTSRAARG